MPRPQKKVKGYLRKVSGQRAKVRVRPHLRIKRVDIKRKGKGK